MSKPKLTFTEATHRYALDGYRVPGVTESLKLAGLAVDYDALPANGVDLARQRGNAVHAATAFDDRRQLDDSTLDPRIAGYIEAWRKFKADMKPKFTAIEKRLASTRYRFAGTIDRIATIYRTPTILDIKTTLTISPFVGLQLAGYEVLAAEGAKLHLPRAAQRLAIKLTSDGLYFLRHCENPTDTQIFLCAVQIANWRISNQAE